MQIKINVYTSFYKKMLQRHKQENDFYIQISRSLFMPVKGVDGLSMNELVDFNLGEGFGMFFETLEEYEDYLKSDIGKENLEELVKLFNLDVTPEEMTLEYEQMTDKEKEQAEQIGFNKDVCTFNFYLLCYEDLESRYTEKDNKKHPELKVGELKKCHRTVLAKVLNELYNLGVKEL